MKIFLKEISLKNYKQYSDHTFSFVKKNGEPYQIVCFFGPNGIGKSTLLEAISVLTMNTAGRSPEAIREYLRKFTSDFDFNIYSQYKEEPPDKMMLTGVFEMEGEDFTVILDENGFVRNDFLPVTEQDGDETIVVKNSVFGDNYLKYYQRISHFIKTDSDLSFYKFQLVSKKADIFERVLSEITGYKTECVKIDGFSEEDNYYCSDCVFWKSRPAPHRCHFKQMSAGEKKVVKAFSEVFNLIHGLETAKSTETAIYGFPCILLYDNIEFHVHYKRHVAFMTCLKEIFNQQQIFSSTHSNVLIERFERGECSDDELFIDIEKT